MSAKENVKKTWNYFTKEKRVKSIIVATLAIGFGVVFGLVINKFFIGQISTDYSGLNADDYSMDMDALMKKYNSLGSVDDYSQKLSAPEMINVGFGLYKNHDNAMSISIGNVNCAGFNQTIRASNVKENGKFMEESISVSGVVQVATRTYQDGEDVKLYRGSNVVTTSAVWPSDFVSYTNVKYAEDFGKTPSEPLIFLVSKKTISESTITRNGTDYVVECVMKKKAAVLNYVKQMKSLSNLSELPSFNSLKIVFTLDENLLIKSMVSYEDYFARIGGLGSTCDGSTEVKYYIDGNYKIPSLSENMNYDFKLGDSNLC